MLCCVSKRALGGGDLGFPYEDRKIETLPVLFEKVEAEAYPEEDVPPVLLPCATCARTFMPESLEKHTRICRRAACKQRKPFDSAKQRIQGTELAEFLPRHEKKRPECAKPKTSWKESHDELLRAVRAARGELVDTSAQKQTSSVVSSGAPTRSHEKGTCPSCHRHFGIKAYDRHVAWCKERSTRLPVAATTNVAKERLEARMKYKAPTLKNRRASNREKYSPGSSITLNSNKSPPSGRNRTKESISSTQYDKDDSPVKQKLNVARRSAQNKESPTRSIMKSRIGDRVDRPIPEYTAANSRLPSSSFPAPPVQRNSRNTAQLKSPANLTAESFHPRDVPTSTLKRKQSDNLEEKNSKDVLDEPRIKVNEIKVPAFKAQKSNIVSARSQGNPKVNDVNVNNDVIGMTVSQCRIYDDKEELVTWSQLCRKNERTQDPEDADSLRNFRLPDLEAKHEYEEDKRDSRQDKGARTSHQDRRVSYEDKSDYHAVQCDAYQDTDNSYHEIDKSYQDEGQYYEVVECDAYLDAAASYLIKRDHYEVLCDAYHDIRDRGKRSSSQDKPESIRRKTSLEKSDIPRWKRSSAQEEPDTARTQCISVEEEPDTARTQRISGREEQDTAQTTRISIEEKPDTVETTRISVEEEPGTVQMTRDSVEEPDTARTTRISAEQESETAQTKRISQEKPGATREKCPSKCKRDSPGEKRSSIPERRRSSQEKRVPCTEKRTSSQDKHIPFPERRSSSQEKHIPFSKKRTSSQEEHIPLPEKRTSSQDKRTSIEARRDSSQEKRTSFEGKRDSSQEKRASLEGRRDSSQEKRSSSQGKLGSFQERRTLSQDKRASFEGKRASSQGKIEPSQEKRISYEGKRDSLQEKRDSSEDKSQIEKEKSISSPKVATRQPKLNCWKVKNKLCVRQETVPKTTHEAPEEPEKRKESIEKEAFVESSKDEPSDWSNLVQQLNQTYLTTDTLETDEFPEAKEEVAEVAEVAEVVEDVEVPFEEVIKDKTRKPVKHSPRIEFCVKSPKEVPFWTEVQCDKKKRRTSSQDTKPPVAEEKTEELPEQPADDSKEKRTSVKRKKERAKGSTTPKPSTIEETEETVEPSKDEAVNGDEIIDEKRESAVEEVAMDSEKLDTLQEESTDAAVDTEEVVTICVAENGDVSEFVVVCTTKDEDTVDSAEVIADEEKEDISSVTVVKAADDYISDNEDESSGDSTIDLEEPTVMHKVSDEEVFSVCSRLTHVADETISEYDTVTLEVVKSGKNLESGVSSCPEQCITDKTILEGDKKVVSVESILSADEIKVIAEDETEEDDEEEDDEEDDQAEEEVKEEEEEEEDEEEEQEEQEVKEEEDEEEDEDEDETEQEDEPVQMVACPSFIKTISVFDQQCCECPEDALLLDQTIVHEEADDDESESKPETIDDSSTIDETPALEDRLVETVCQTYEEKIDDGLQKAPVLEERLVQTVCQTYEPSKPRSVSKDKDAKAKTKSKDSARDVRAKSRTRELDKDAKAKPKSRELFKDTRGRSRSRESEKDTKPRTKSRESDRDIKARPKSKESVKYLKAKTKSKESVKATKSKSREIKAETRSKPLAKGIKPRSKSTESDKGKTDIPSPRDKLGEKISADAEPATDISKIHTSVCVDTSDDGEFYEIPRERCASYVIRRGSKLSKDSAEIGATDAKSDGAIMSPSKQSIDLDDDLKIAENVEDKKEECVCDDTGKVMKKSESKQLVFIETQEGADDEDESHEALTDTDQENGVTQLRFIRDTVEINKKKMQEKYLNKSFGQESPKESVHPTEKVKRRSQEKSRGDTICYDEPMEVLNKMRKNMNLLRGTTDNLVSCVDNSQFHSKPHSVDYFEQETIELIDPKKRGKDRQMLPEIKHDPTEMKENLDKQSVNAGSYWEKASKISKSRLVFPDSSSYGECRKELSKRNPRTLPPVPCPSGFVRKSGSTNNYDPFLLAEQQMNDLLSDTSGESLADDVSLSSHNRANLFPLSHSSAFVKYPYQTSNTSPDKRTSLIAPPTEFDDLTSDFSSDSTETNSLSREIFLRDSQKDSKEQELSNNLDKSEKRLSNADKIKSPSKELGRRVIIDKSKALGNEILDDQVVRGGRSFVGSTERARKILDKVTPKVIKPVVNRSHSIRAASAPKPTPERKTNNSSSLGTKRNNSKYDQAEIRRNSSGNASINRNNNYTNLGGSNLSLNSIVSSDTDMKRSNSVFEELMTSYEIDRGSFPSLRSILRDESLSMSSPVTECRRNGRISDDEFSSPDSYKRQDHGKTSADSAYSSLNRKSSNTRATNDVQRLEEKMPGDSKRNDTVACGGCKMSKFCHECGAKFPDTAKYCCNCGVRRLVL